MKSVEQLYRQGALATDDTTQSVYIEGASNLAASEQDRERLHQLLKTLEEKQKVVQLLSAYLDTKQEAVRVVIGLDSCCGADPTRALGHRPGDPVVVFHARGLAQSRSHRVQQTCRCEEARIL